MPDTFVGLVFFAALASPGIVYTTRRRAYMSGAKPSAFNETATVVLISLVFVGLSVGIFIATSILAESITPNIDAFIADPGATFRADYEAWLLWGVGVLGLATVGAWLIARIQYPGDRAARLKSESSWRSVLRLNVDDDDPCYVYVEVFLTDNSRVSGYITDFDGRLDSGDNRDLVLSAPITYVDSGGRKLDSDANYVAVHAPRVNFLAVHYGVAHPDSEDCGPQP